MHYLIKRLALLVPTLFGVTTLVFCMRFMVPGDPVEIMFFGQRPEPHVVEEMRRNLGLDRPMYEQYYQFVSRAVKGDLGKSLRTGRSVTEELRNRYPRTLVLAAASLGIAVVVGVGMGVLAAAYQDRLIDTLSMLLSLVGVSMPSFWLGLILMNLFAVKLKWLPALGSESARHLLLPAVTIGLIASAIIARMTRSNLLEVLRQDFVRTARAKGVSERIVLFRHALRNALIPVVTIVGLQFGYLLGGTFVVERVFGWNGIGELAITAIEARDFALIQAIVLVVASTYVLVNLAVDLLYAVLDPRISYQ